MSSKKNEINNDIAILKRRATTYIKEYGFQICEGLSQQPLWKESQINNQFSKNRFFIPKMVSRGLLNPLKDSDE